MGIAVVLSIFNQRIVVNDWDLGWFLDKVVGHLIYDLICLNCLPKAFLKINRSMLQ